MQDRRKSSILPSNHLELYAHTTMEGISLGCILMHCCWFLPCSNIWPTRPSQWPCLPLPTVGSLQGLAIKPVLIFPPQHPLLASRTRSISRAQPCLLKAVFTPPVHIPLFPYPVASKHNCINHRLPFTPFHHWHLHPLFPFMLAARLISHFSP